MSGCSIVVSGETVTTVAAHNNATNPLQMLRIERLAVFTKQAENEFLQNLTNIEALAAAGLHNQLTHAHHSCWTAQPTNCVANSPTPTAVPQWA